MAGWVLSPSKREFKVQDQYRLGQILGKGAFGIVYLATDLADNKQYACKSINKAKLVTEEDVKDVQREVEILNLVSDHPNVAELVNAFEDAHYVHLILELCRGGELFDRIVEQGTFTERAAADYFRTMVLVIDHMHQLGVMHRDIKPENFLLTDKSDNARLKLCDFGLSSYWKPGDRLQSIVGSCYYVAPEVLRRDYGVEADMWSLGVMLYILLSGLPPFWGDKEEDIFRMVLKADLDFQTPPWPSISQAAKDCVRQLLNVAPKARPTASQLLQHAWLKAHGAALDKPLDSVVLTRIKKLSAMNKLKKAALVVMAQSLSEDEINGLQQLFRSIDADGNGTITIDELRTALSSLNGRLQDEADLGGIMAAADLDGDGTLNYEEFIAATVNLNKLEKEANILAAFNKFDTDHSGALTKDEIREALSSMGSTDEEVERLIDEYDTNHDGEIDYPEFLAMMRANNDGLRAASTYLRRRSGVCS
ncbi:g6460 [Coccomyxa elongata]